MSARWALYTHFILRCRLMYGNTTSVQCVDRQCHEFPTLCRLPIAQSSDRQHTKDMTQVLSISESETVDTYGAVDATVRVGGVVGYVTLIPRQDGELDRWGAFIGCWASRELHDLGRDAQDEIIEAVNIASVVL